jgi:hypothetical protein
MRKVKVRKERIYLEDRKKSTGSHARWTVWLKKHRETEEAEQIRKEFAVPALTFPCRGSCSLYHKVR